MKYLVELKGISKAFSGVAVLEKVNLAVRPGSIHALIGGNGAGKSTLMKILSGLYQPDAGEIVIGEQREIFKNPNDAHNKGIYLVPQDPMLYPHLTIAENIRLSVPGRGKLHQAKLTELMQSLGCDFQLGQLAGELTIAKQQQIELIRGLIRETEVIVLDEPTATLTAKETEKLFNNLRKLKASKALAVIYITHRLHELFEIADEVSVLKDKKVILSKPIAECTLDQIIRIMVPPQLKRQEVKTPSKEGPGAVGTAGGEILSVRAYSGPGFREVSFGLRQSEILGLTGVVGAGRTEFAEALFGLRKRYSGSLSLFGQEINLKSPKDAIARGLAYVPEDRHLHGGFLEISLKNNLTAAILSKLFKLLIRNHRELAVYDYYKACFNINSVSPEQQLGYLSGGNQQKVVLAKWLATKPKVIIFDEPTRGIDAGAREDIYRIIKDLARQGMGVIVISSDFEEITLLCDRVVVMLNGQTTAELTGPDISMENITYASFGYAREV